MLILYPALYWIHLLVLIFVVVESSGGSAYMIMSPTNILDSSLVLGGENHDVYCTEGKTEILQVNALAQSHISNAGQN